jgi:hypothetical protein
VSVVMMSPDGTLGNVPAENVEIAKAAGFRVMTPADLKTMYNRIFMEHSLIKHTKKKFEKKFGRRARLNRRSR